MVPKPLNALDSETNSDGEKTSDKYSDWIRESVGCEASRGFGKSLWPYWGELLLERVQYSPLSYRKAVAR